MFVKRVRQRLVRQISVCPGVFTPSLTPPRQGEGKSGRARRTGHYVARGIGSMNASMLRPSVHHEPATARQLAEERSARAEVRREERWLGKGLGWYATFLALAVALFV